MSQRNATLGYLLLTSSLVSVTTRLSRDQDRVGSEQYNIASLALSVDVAKIIVSMIMFHRTTTHDERNADAARAGWKSPMTWILGLFPSLLYLAQNILATWALSILPAAIFSSLLNLRVLFTAVLARLVFREHVSVVKGLSLVLLVCAAMVNSLAHVSSEHDVCVVEDGRQDILVQPDSRTGGAESRVETVLALSVCCGIALSSAVAGIIMQSVMQKQVSSIWEGNVVLSATSLVANMLIHAGMSLDFFAHWTAYTFVAVGVSVLHGIVTARAIAVAGSVAKTVVGTLALVIISVLDLGLFNESINATRVLGQLMLCTTCVQLALLNASAADAEQERKETTGSGDVDVNDDIELLAELRDVRKEKAGL